MKTKLLPSLLALALLAHSPKSHGANLFWDPDDTGLGGSGGSTSNLGWNNGTGAFWETSSGVGNNITWSNGNDATLAGGAGAGDPMSLATSISGGTLTVLTDGYSLQTNSSARTFNFTSLALTNAASDYTLTTGNAGAINGSTYQFTLGSVTGAGDLSIVNASGNNTKVSLALTGMANGPLIDLSSSGSTTGKEIGILGTSATAAVSGNISASSGIKTVLAATTGNKLTLSNMTNPSTGSSMITIGSSVNKGTVQLDSGANLTNTAPTTQIDIAGGTLLIAANGVIGDSMNIKTSGGNLAFANSASPLSENVGTLTLATSSVLDMGTGAGGSSIYFDPTNLASWGGNVLSIWNYTPGSDHIYFGTSNSGLLGMNSQGVQTGYYDPTVGAIYGFTRQIQFYSGAGTGLFSQHGAGITGLGEIVPVPEPNAVLSLGLLVLAIGWKERKHFLRSRSPSGGGKLAMV